MQISVVIPSRNEQFLSRTIQDLLSNATSEIEVIAVLDGYWPEAHKTAHWSTPAIIEDKRVHYIHFPEPRGMRAAINAGVDIAKGEYILKSDGHCMFAKGFDTALMADMADNWISIPTRKRLEPESWTLRDVEKPDINYMFLTYPNDDKEWGGREFSGREWREKNSDPTLKDKLIDDAMSFQGSAWFMKKDYFHFLELLDEETYGPFWKEAQEIGFKCWLSGGRVIRNKKTWYAHLHKGKTYGRGYSLDKSNPDQAKDNILAWMTRKMWHKQKYPLSFMIKKFPDAPMWTPERIKEADYAL